MSILYEMSVHITGASKDLAVPVMEAADREWQGFAANWSDSWRWRADGLKTQDPGSPLLLESYGQGSLCGGESEQEFSRRLAAAIWAANSGFCHMEVKATCLTDLPFESFAFDEEAYDEMVAGDWIACDSPTQEGPVDE